jgi:hypothetical protein
MSLKEQYDAAQIHKFQDACKAMKALAVEHVSSHPGHRVWTHFRNPMDFHVECFTCQGRGDGTRTAQPVSPS